MKNGSSLLSKIVLFVEPGAGVVTTRAHIHYVVTEYSFANLHGLNIEERSKALIALSAPEHRDYLEKNFMNYGYRKRLSKIRQEIKR